MLTPKFYSLIDRVIAVTHLVAVIWSIYTFVDGLPAFSDVDTRKFVILVASYALLMIPLLIICLGVLSQKIWAVKGLIVIYLLQIPTIIIDEKFAYQLFSGISLSAGVLSVSSWDIKFNVDFFNAGYYLTFGGSTGFNAFMIDLAAIFLIFYFSRRIRQLRNASQTI